MVTPGNLDHPEKPWPPWKTLPFGCNYGARTGAFRRSSYRGDRAPSLAQPPKLCFSHGKSRSSMLRQTGGNPPGKTRSHSGASRQGLTLEPPDKPSVWSLQTRSQSGASREGLSLEPPDKVSVSSLQTRSQSGASRQGLSLEPPDKVTVWSLQTSPEGCHLGETIF